MKDYVAFITFKNGFEIMRFKEKNRTYLTHSLRSLGYKVSLVLSAETYEYYQLTDPFVFFDTYPHFYDVYKHEVVMKNMFPEWGDDDV